MRGKHLLIFEALSFGLKINISRSGRRRRNMLEIPSTIEGCLSFPSVLDPAIYDILCVLRVTHARRRTKYLAGNRGVFRLLEFYGFGFNPFETAEAKEGRVKSRSLATRDSAGIGRRQGPISERTVSIVCLVGKKGDRSK